MCYIFIYGILLICYNIFYIYKNFMGFPGCLVVKNPPVIQCQRSRFDLWVKKIPWRRKQQRTPVFLPGESHGQESLMGQSPWGHKRVGHNTVTKQQKVSYLPNTDMCACLYPQLCSTLCDPVDCGLLGSSDHGIFQAKVLKWFASTYSRESSQPRD